MAPKKIALVTDSCADLSRALIEENDIHVIPLRISCADGEFSDGVDISAADVYTRLHAGELPKTSLPTGEDVERVLRTLVKEGYDGAIAIMLSSGLSGTYNLMRLCAQDVKDELDVRVYDSKSGSLGQGMTVFRLAEDIRSGMSWEELTERRVPDLLGRVLSLLLRGYVGIPEKGRTHRKGDRGRGHTAEDQAHSDPCLRRSAPVCRQGAGQGTGHRQAGRAGQSGLR